MKLVVQKFGGTSLNTSENRLRAATQIKNCISSGNSPVVVVSAMGRIGDPYSTDSLLKMAEDTFQIINPREKDILMSCGEILSAVIMVQTLKSINIEASVLTGAQSGIITDNIFGRSRVKYVNPVNIMKVIKSGKVPVVAGFQGLSEQGEITTLGRGGSDTTASVIAAAIKAEFIEIYSDVQGIMTADPKKVKTAKLINELSYDDVFELTNQGARIIHPRAAEIARESNIPIKVKSTFMNSSSTYVHAVNTDKPIIGVVNRNQIGFVRIIPQTKKKYATGLKIFKILGEANISVDFIDIRPDEITFVIDIDFLNRIKNILSQNEFDFEITNDFVMVSVVGAGMTGLPGIMSKIVEALTKKDICIFQTTDSHSSISCLILKEQETSALNILHEVFEL